MRTKERLMEYTKKLSVIRFEAEVLAQITLDRLEKLKAKLSLFIESKGGFFGLKLKLSGRSRTQYLKLKLAVEKLEFKLNKQLKRVSDIERSLFRNKYLADSL